MTNEERDLLREKLRNKQSGTEEESSLVGGAAKIRNKDKSKKQKVKGGKIPKKFIIIGIIVFVVLLLGVFVYMAGSSDSGSGSGSGTSKKNKQEQAEQELELLNSAPDYTGFLSNYRWDDKHFKVSYYGGKDGSELLAKYDLIPSDSTSDSSVTKVLTFGDIVMTVYMNNSEPKLFMSILDNGRKQWCYCKLPVGIDIPDFIQIVEDEKAFGLDIDLLSRAKLVRSYMSDDGVTYDVLQLIQNEDEYNYVVNRDKQSVDLFDNYIVSDGQKIHEQVHFAEIGRVEASKDIWDSREMSLDKFRKKLLEVRNQLPVGLNNLVFIEIDEESQSNMMEAITEPVDTESDLSAELVIENVEATESEGVQETAEETESMPNTEHEE